MLLKAEFECTEVKVPIEYALLRPDSDSALDAGAPLPLLYVLHGGGGSRDYLTRVAPAIEQAWAQGALPKVIAVTPTSSEFGYYMNFFDGSERWEDALTGSFLRHIREAHGASSERQHTLTCGPSMGGMGSLRLAFKHPEIFGGVAALAPGIRPVFEFRDIDPSDLFWRTREPLTKAFGDPLDPAYWRANNPASIAQDAPARLRDSGLAIYLECGDKDAFGLQRGAEFLHRVLFDNGISHEYRLVRGADHVGATLPSRFRDVLGFLAQVIAPPPPDPAVAALHEQIAKMTRDGAR